MSTPITRTIIGVELQDELVLGKTPRIKQFTTLNERFQIQSGVVPAATDRYSAKYFVIGNGGHRLITGADGIPIVDPLQKETTDFGLYKPMPFVLRPITADLSATERERYCLRREEEHNGERYIAYHGRREDLTAVIPQTVLRITRDGQTITTPFVPSRDNLYPTPQPLSSTGVNVTTGDYAAVTAPFELNFTALDVQELLNVANVMYGSENYAIISEIGYCTGVDKVIQVNASGGGAFVFNEVLACQIFTHIAGFYPLVYATKGFGIEIDVGGAEPLYRLSALAT